MVSILSGATIVLDCLVHQVIDVRDRSAVTILVGHTLTVRLLSLCTCSLPILLSFAGSLTGTPTRFTLPLEHVTQTRERVLRLGLVC